MLTSVEVSGKWVLSVEDWAEIRRLHRTERMPIKVIARVLGCSKNTVKKAFGRRAAAGVSDDSSGARWWIRWSRGFGSCCRPAPRCRQR
jgi:IS30 family transposase